MGRKIGLEVSSGRADQGDLSSAGPGTSVTTASNKVPQVRAALFSDAETANDARIWDGANMLAHEFEKHIYYYRERDLERVVSEQCDYHWN